jgi:hypothetical protein
MEETQRCSTATYLARPLDWATTNVGGSAHLVDSRTDVMIFLPMHCRLLFAGHRIHSFLHALACHRFHLQHGQHACLKLQERAHCLVVAQLMR